MFVINVIICPRLRTVEFEAGSELSNLGFHAFLECTSLEWKLSLAVASVCALHSKALRLNRRRILLRSIQMRPLPIRPGKALESKYNKAKSIAKMLPIQFGEVLIPTRK
jgi:hypothetical protein